MTDAREIIASTVEKKLTVDGFSTYSEMADHILSALTAAGFRILGPDEVDPVTLEKSAAELASIEPDEDAAGGPANWGDFVQIAQSHVRALGRKA